MIKKAYILITLAGVLTACTKEIDMELNTSEPRLVIESLLTDSLQPFTVKLTLTTAYFDQNGEDHVTNASVFISDNLGNVDTLYYTAFGVYSTIGNRQAVLGRTYNLLVVYNGQNYTATSSMPATKMLVDSIGIIYNEGTAFIEEGYNVILNAQENGNSIDFYRFNFYKNDTLQTDPFKYFVVDDQPVQGNYIQAQVPYNYQSGDTARIEILSIPKPYFQYLTAVSLQTQASGGPFDPPPANPPTNITNGGLGFFGVAGFHSRWRIIP